jgi:Phage tail protein
VTLLQYQLQMPNGTVLGNQTGVELTGITGLLDMPPLRQADASRGQRDGSIPGLNFVGARSVGINYQITMVANNTTAEAKRALASAAHQNVSDPATVCMSGGDYLRQYAGIGTTKPVSAVQVQLVNRPLPLMFFGRPDKYATNIDMNFSYGQINIASEWACPDGLLYDVTVATGTCGLPNPVAGFVFPAVFPAVFGSSTGGSFSLTNAGSYPANPLFVISGPCTRPTIYNLTTGQQIRLNITLGVGDTLMIDVQSGVVTLNGQVNRNNTLDMSSVLFQIVPGTASIGFGTIDSVAVTGSLTGYLLPTYATI